MPELDFSRIRRLRPGDLQLDGCGRPEKPDKPYVDLFKVYVYSATLTSGQLLVDERKVIDPEFDFYLARVGMIATFNVGFRFRLQYPNGHWSSQARGPLLEGVYPPIRIPAGEWIGIELENAVDPAVGITQIVLTFEGWQRVYLVEVAQ